MASDHGPENLKLVADPRDRGEDGGDEIGERDTPGFSSSLDPGRRLEAAFGPISHEDHDETDQDMDQEPNQQTDQPRRGRMLPMLVSLLLLTVFAGVIWYSYNWGRGGVENEELPVIRADETPVKTRPEKPGGIEVRHQDKLVLNEITSDPEKPQAERLLPPPETPIPPVVEPAAPRAETTDDTIPHNTEALLPPPPPPPPAAQEEAAAKAPEEPIAETPKKVVAETPKPSIVETPKEVATETPKEPASETPTPAAKEAIAAVPAPAVVPTTTGGFVVQLASLKSKEGPETLWRRLEKKFPTLLADTTLDVQTIDLGSRGIFYRARAGFFADRAAAEAFCKKLKAGKQDCLVTKR